MAALLVSMTVVASVDLMVDLWVASSAGTKVVSLVAMKGLGWVA